MSNVNQHTNRLINEKSPYLLQHAHNPVDWYPWGEEAFAKAAAEGKPIFLSIGYSTCHWCHVMEKESFDDEEVAAVLNSKYVPIKVDREERPDIDHVYMSVCHALTGSGGWPLTILMTPDTKPFFAGTYFPKEGDYERPGLLDLLNTIEDQWQKNKDKIVEHADGIIESLQKEPSENNSQDLSKEVLELCYNQLLLEYDAEFGGFGRAPKFPAPHNLMFLLRYWHLTGEAKALEMVEKTLTMMRRGGIYDHIGGGFARYSTDERWFMPHFEKMSYDNSLLCYTYLEAYQCTGNEDFRQVAQEILAYELRDMTGPDGEFYSAEDADSEGVEGLFYLWEKKEIISLLGADDGELFCECYDVTRRGNSEEGNILNYIELDWQAIAKQHKLSLEQLQELMANCRNKLFAARQERVHPFKDDKVLTSWNALMIAAMSKAARVLNNDAYAQSAQKALAFIEKNLVREDGRLLTRYRDGEAANPACIDDYANLIWAFIELFESVQQPELLQKAEHWAHEMIRLFGDDKNGGFFFYGSDAEKLISKPKELYDGATPSGNSVAVYTLLRLSELTENKFFGITAQKAIAAFAEEIQFFPKIHTFFLVAFAIRLSPPKHIVIAGPKSDETVQKMWQLACRTFVPEAALLLAEAQAAAILPPTENMPKGDNAAAYICENFACQQPIYDLKQLELALAKKPYEG